MGTFGQSFTRELGKNTGKYVSNKVFGTGHATPHRLIIEREERRAQREEAREYKEKQQRLEKERREREKAMREAEKERQLELRQETIKANEQEVKEHNNYIEAIQSVHKSYSEKFDWSAIELEVLEFENNSPEVPAKEKKEYFKKWTDEQVDKLKQEEEEKLELSPFKRLFNKYFPNHNGGFIDKLLFKEDYEKIDQHNKQLQKIESYRSKWYLEYMEEQEKKYQDYLLATQYYKNLGDVLKGLEKNNPQAIQSSIKIFNPFQELEAYGSDISCEVKGKSMKVHFYVHDNKVIPNVTKSLIRKGVEISESEIPTSRRNEIYQDYVCSCMIRIAKEIFQMFDQMDKVQVNAAGMLLNSATGNMEEKVIASVIFTKSILDGLNLDLIDPSDSISNFEHTMRFDRSKGFSPVEELKVF